MDSKTPLMRPVSASSSVYSQDDVTIADVSPVTPYSNLTRQNSTSTTTSQASTLYVLNPAQTLGYTPFEYWKGPKPVAYSGQAVPKQTTKVHRPPQIKTSTIPKGLVNSRPGFQPPVPTVKVREIEMVLKQPAPAVTPKITRRPVPPPPPPPSPRVKDRYRQRELERARRRAARRAQRALAEGNQEWPGWVPSEKAVRRAGGGTNKSSSSNGRPRRNKTPMAKRFSTASTIIFAPLKERWWDPRTWRRRAWGIVSLVFALAIVAALILGGVMAGNDVVGPHGLPRQTVVPRAAVEAGDVAGVQASMVSASAAIAPEEPARRVRMVARRFDG